MNYSYFTKNIIITCFLFLNNYTFSQQKQIINIPIECLNNVDSSSCNLISITRDFKNDSILLKLPECPDYDDLGIIIVSAIKEKDYNYYSSKRFKRALERASKKEHKFNPKKGYKGIGRKIKTVRRNTDYLPELDLTRLKDGIYYVSGRYKCGDPNLKIELKK